MPRYRLYGDISPICGAEVELGTYVCDNQQEADDEARQQAVDYYGIEAWAELDEAEEPRL